MSRKLEIIIGYVGAALCLVFLGGFTVITNVMTETDYQKIFQPIFNKGLVGLSDQAGMTLFQTLGSWFGITLIAVLIIVAIANLLLRHHHRIKIAGLLYLFAGLITLFGSQLLAYPLAFIFFVVSGLCFLRKDLADV